MTLECMQVLSSIPKLAVVLYYCCKENKRVQSEKESIFLPLHLFFFLYGVMHCEPGYPLFKLNNNLNSNIPLRCSSSYIYLFT